MDCWQYMVRAKIVGFKLIRGFYAMNDGQDIKDQQFREKWHKEARGNCVDERLFFKQIREEELIERKPRLG